MSESISPISPSMIDAATQILDWARDYLSSEHEGIRRPHGSQTVCPFVPGSLKGDCFYIVFHPEVSKHPEKLIEQILLGYISEFDTLWPFEDKDDQRKALLVVFPGLDTRQTKVLDKVHQRLKSKFVQEGLMIGQFHPNCDERAFFNPEFRVSVCPVPLIAIRNMSVHDVLFLKDNAVWFAKFNILFGHKFASMDTLGVHNSHLMPYY